MAITTPFAQNGDKKEIPQTSSDGSLSFDKGFGSLYALPPEEGGLFIDREQFNQLVYQITEAILANQQSLSNLSGNVYNKGEVDNLVNAKANQSTTYTKNEVNNLVNPKADKSTTYTKGEVDNLVNAKANQSTTYTKSEVDTRLNAKANANAVVNLSGNQTIAGVKTFRSPIVVPNGTANNHAVNLAQLNTKANANAVVNLTGNQSIAGAKTFTSNITAPNITTLQNQMNGLSGLISGGKSPYLLQDEGFISILVGAGLNPRDYEGGGHYHKVFTNLTDTFSYLKKNGLSSLDPYIMITTNSEFNDDLSLSELPACQITAGYKFANNLHIRNCSGIIFEHLVLGGNLTVENSNITIQIADIRSRVVDEYYSREAFEKSSIVAINSTIIIAGHAQFYPSNDACSIVAKEGSQVIITNSNVYQNTPSRYFAYVESGGKIVSGGRGGIVGSFEAKTNVAPNTWSPNGMILGSHWG